MTTRERSNNISLNKAGITTCSLPIAPRSSFPHPFPDPAQHLSTTAVQGSTSLYCYKNCAILQRLHYTQKLIQKGAPKSTGCTVSIPPILIPWQTLHHAPHKAHQPVAHASMQREAERGGEGQQLLVPDQGMCRDNLPSIACIGHSSSAKPLEAPVETVWHPSNSTTQPGRHQKAQAERSASSKSLLIKASNSPNPPQTTFKWGPAERPSTHRQANARGWQNHACRHLPCSTRRTSRSATASCQAR